MSVSCLLYSIMLRENKRKRRNVITPKMQVALKHIFERGLESHFEMVLPNYAEEHYNEYHDTAVVVIYMRKEGLVL